MSIAGKKIVVVGAGIGGLAAALALHRRGGDVVVLEQAERITEVGAGLQVSPNGVAVLRALGLGTPLAEQSVRAQAVSLRDYRRAGEVLRLDLQQHASDLDYLFLHRADLIGLLAEAVRGAGIPIRLLQRVEHADIGETCLNMSNGTRIGGDLIIGADGLHSRLRVALNGAEQPFFTGQVAWRAIVPNITDHPPEARLYMGPGRHLVSYPLRGATTVNLVAVQERAEWTAEGWNHRDDPDNLRAAFADFGGAARVLLDQVSDVHLWGLFRHDVARKWHDGAVAILGDAAHPTLPFMAQGAVMALEDAWVLSEALDQATDMTDGLARYQARRRPRVQKVIAAANGNAWKYHLRFPPLRGAAHLALRLAGAAVPARMVEQFDWIYRHDVTRGD